MFLIDALMRRFSFDLAMDLGTANTLIYQKGKGIVLNQPSVVAVPETGSGVLAVGEEAKRMYGRTPEGVRTVRPMKDGVIADFEITNRMVMYFIRQVHRRNSFVRPKMIISVPSGITQVEKRSVIEAAQMAGASRVFLLEEPMAAAIGAKLPVESSQANMVVDIGGGTTEVAVINLFATAYCESLRVAGDEMDEAIQRHLHREHQLDIGIFEAQRLKHLIGSAMPFEEPCYGTARGRKMSGIPATVQVEDAELREALEEPVRAIVQSIKVALERTSPELAADVTSRGLVLAGGGALLHGLGPRLHKETGLPIFRAKDPLTTIVRGAGIVLENFKTLRRVCIN
ncbi:MAG: rod shape-determining protein [Candidatus Tectomicrobia bacterium]|nr:rod shape-determining protein [Candidatus Tectomicrobia bacterium]